MKRVILPFLAILSLASCYNDKAELLYPVTSCDTASVTYSGVVGQILTTNCASDGGCHKAADSATSMNVCLDNVYSAQRIARDNNRLVRVINHESGVAEMPKNRAKLDDCSIRKIEIWVEQGSPNN